MKRSPRSTVSQLLFIELADMKISRLVWHHPTCRSSVAGYQGFGPLSETANQAHCLLSQNQSENILRLIAVLVKMR